MPIEGVPTDKEFLYSLRERFITNYGESPDEDHILRLDILIGATDSKALCI